MPPSGEVTYLALPGSVAAAAMPTRPSLAMEAPAPAPALPPRSRSTGEPAARARLSLHRKFAGLGVLCAVAAALQGIATWRDHHAVFINMSESLPNWAFLVESGRFPDARGQYVVFAPPRSPLVVAHFGAEPKAFAKIVHGLPGDLVTRQGNELFVNGVRAAMLKPRTRKGEVLVPGPLGRVPERCLFAATPHKDGFDSRYAAIGWVCADRIVGVGTPVL